MSDLSLTLSTIAILLSALTVWRSFFWRGAAEFVCSSWTAIRMTGNDDRARAAFCVTLSIGNPGNRPLTVFDLLLKAEIPDRGTIFYEPILYWDIRQWIEDGARKDKVGRTQKGQVPLPVQLPPQGHFDYGYPILFLPLDKSTLVEPGVHKSVTLRLFAFTSRGRTYAEIGTQHISAEDLNPLTSMSFSGLVSSESRKRRHLLVGNS